MTAIIRNAKRTSARARWATAAAALSLSAAILALWPLAATANHAEPQLPLTATIVQGISDCAPPAPDIGTSIPAGTVGNATTPPDRNNTSTSNEHTAGTNADLVIHANAESDPKELTLDISGSHNVFDGLIDSRSHLKISGSWNLLRHGTEYGQRSEPGKVAFDLTGSNNCFSPIPVQEYENAPPASPAGFPFDAAFDPDKDGNILEHFAPGTTAANNAINHTGAINLNLDADPEFEVTFPAQPLGRYFVCGIPATGGARQAPGCAGSGASAIMDRNVQAQVLEPGLYFVTGRAKLSASNLNAMITIVSGQQLNVNGSFQGQGFSVFRPYTDAGGAFPGTLLFASQWDEAANLSGPSFPDGSTANDSPNTDKAEDALKVEGSLSRFEGIIVATNGRNEIAGEQLDFRCPVMGDRVRVNGSKNYFNAAGCVQQPGLTISKTPDLANQVDGTVNAGQPAKFTITVTNGGGGTAVNVDIDDTLPGTGLTWSVTSATKSGNNLVAPDNCGITPPNVLHCDVAELLPGQSIVVVVSSSNTTTANQCAAPPNGDGGVLDNGTAAPGAAGDALADADNNPQVNDPGKIVVTCPDLRVFKTPDLAADVGGTINAGQPAVFTITVTNNGTGAATNVDIDDTLPGTGLTWSVTSAQKNGGNLVAPDACAITPPNVLHCDVASLPSGQSIVVVVTSSATTTANQCAAPPDGDGGALRNGTDLAGAAGDALADADNNAQVNDPGEILVTCPNLIIAKTPDLANQVGGTINAGQPAVFTITVTNNGTGAATNVDIDDTLPGTGLTWSVTSAQKNGGNLVAPDACAITPPNVLHCDVASLPAGQSIVVVVTSSNTTTANQCGAAPNGDGGVLDNGTADAGAAGDALADADNNAQVNDPGKIIVTCPDLRVSKTPDLAADVGGTINAGQPAVFTITVTNNGTGAATNVDIDDTLPGTGLTWSVTSAQKNGGTLVAPDACAITPPNVLHCDVASLPAGQSIVVVVTSSNTTTANQCAAAPNGDGGVLRNGTDLAGAAGDALADADNNAQVNDPGEIQVACAAIQIFKKSTKTGNPFVSQPGAVFSVDGPDPGTAPDFTVKDDNTPIPAGTRNDEKTVLAIGTVCVSGLEPGNYTVNESSPPFGYGAASETNVVAVAAPNTDCGANSPTADNSATFLNPPLAHIQVNYRDGGSGETLLTSIDCAGLGASPDVLDPNPPTPWTSSVTHENIPINPSPRTVTCTIIIDP